MAEQTIESQTLAGSLANSDPGVRAASSGGWVFLIGSVLLSSAAQVLLKAGAVSGNAPLAGSAVTLGVFFEPLVIFGLVLYGTGTLLWIKCLTRLELSLAYLVSALQYVFVFVAAKLLFAESLSATRLFGLAVILIGIVIVTRKRKS